jgi:hypothetical protein
VLALVRPARDAGVPRYRTTALGRDSLPLMDPVAMPEVWVLTPGEALLHKGLITPIKGLDHNSGHIQHMVTFSRLGRRRRPNDRWVTQALMLGLVPRPNLRPGLRSKPGVKPGSDAAATVPYK